jgi:DNA-binding transcriptional ArsR family regulator
MADLELIRPQQSINVSFGLKPAHNVLTSLLLLNMADTTSGFSDWVYDTVASLPPQRLWTNQIACNALHMTACPTEEREWPDFPAWIDYLAASDPFALRDRELEAMIGSIARCGGPTYDPAALLSDRRSYLAAVETYYELCHEKPLPDMTLYEDAHVLLNDPPQMLDAIVDHLRIMWHEVLEPAWQAALPILQESALALQKLDYSGLSFGAILQAVAERDLPGEWEDLEGSIRTLVFIPSAHIGPYLLMLRKPENGVAWIVIGARQPRGATVASPTLSRTELLMSLSALADDMRLQILKFIASEGEQGAQEVITHFDLSQSSASRHLRQLSATGYLIERRHDGAKRYQLNRERIDDTLNTLKAYLED